MIPKVLVDSSIFISFKDKKDIHFTKAFSILSAFMRGEIKEVYITNYVVLEVTNYLLSRNSFETAHEMYNYLIEQMTVIFVDEILQERIMKQYKKYKSLSLTDCSLLVIAEDYHLDTIFSLDSGFDKTNIVRKERFIGNNINIRIQ